MLTVIEVNVTVYKSDYSENKRGKLKTPKEWVITVADLVVLNNRSSNHSTIISPRMLQCPEADYLHSRLSIRI